MRAGRERGGPRTAVMSPQAGPWGLRDQGIAAARATGPASASAQALYPLLDGWKPSTAPTAVPAGSAASGSLGIRRRNPRADDQLIPDGADHVIPHPGPGVDGVTDRLLSSTGPAWWLAAGARENGDRGGRELPDRGPPSGWGLLASGGGC